MSFVSKVRLCAAFAVVAVGFSSVAFSMEITPPDGDKRIASQYFERYQDQYNRGGGQWGIIDDLDIAELLEQEDFDKLNHEVKAMFTTDNENGKSWNRKIQFDVQWTRKTLAKMYPEKWAAIKATKDRKLRRQMIRDLRSNACDAQMEVGHARTYGINYDRNVLEMDTHATPGCPRGAKVGTTRMRTFISTVPNAEYMLTIKYQKRDYNYEKFGVKNEKKAYRDLIVRVDSDKHKLPLAKVAGEVLEAGFKTAQIPFTASRFYTKLQLRDSGHPDSYGILIDSVVVEKVKDNPRLTECKLYNHENSKRLRQCLTGDYEPAMFGCNLQEAQMNWVKGAHTIDTAQRSRKENIFNPTQSNFLSLGAGGKVKFKLRGYNVRAACPVYGKTLSVGEVTNGNKTFETYAEQASVKVKLVRCYKENMNGWKVLKNQNAEAAADSSSIVTSRGFGFTFDGSDYNGCAVSQIVIKDETDDIPETQAGYVAKSDGVDLYNLAIGAVE